MPVNALKRMLACVAADGSAAAQGIIEDESASKAPAPARGSAPLLKKIVLDGLLPGDLLLCPDLSLGKDRCVSKLLSTVSGTDQNRMCDGIIIRVRNSNENGARLIDVGYFDLKSGNPNGYEGQFLSAQCFFNSYVMALLKIFYGLRCRVGRERYVVFHTDKAGRVPSIRKTTTRHTPNSANSPHNAKKIPVVSGQRVLLAEVIS